jgi:hypothetical protein
MASIKIVLVAKVNEKYAILATNKILLVAKI